MTAFATTQRHRLCHLTQVEGLGIPEAAERLGITVALAEALLNNSPVQPGPGVVPPAIRAQRQLDWAAIREALFRKRRPCLAP